MIEEQTESDMLQEILADVRKDVEGGTALSEALKKHPDIFNDLYVAMVEAGETGGILDQTLVRVAEQLESDAALRRQVKAAMIYPILIGSFSLIVLVALVAFLVPVFEKIFADFGGELPAITKFTVLLSHLVTRQWYIADRGGVRRRLDLQDLEEVRPRPDPMGQAEAEVPDEDRRTSCRRWRWRASPGPSPG